MNGSTVFRLWHVVAAVAATAAAVFVLLAAFIPGSDPPPETDLAKNLDAAESRADDADTRANSWIAIGGFGLALGVAVGVGVGALVAYRIQRRRLEEGR